LSDQAREAAEAMLEPAAVAFSTNDEERVGLSIAISLKRLADVAGGFTDHPDRRNDYGEFGLAALMGELRRFKQEVLNDISSFLHRR
jgi:hypothetical protein